MEDQNRATLSTYIVDDLIRFGREPDVSPEEKMRIDLLNAAAESSGLKKELQKLKYKIAVLKKQKHEIWGKEIRTSAVNNSARIMILSFMKISSLNDEAKQLLQHVLSVLEAPGNTEVGTNLVDGSIVNGMDPDSEEQTEFTDLMTITSTSGKALEFLPRISKRCQSPQTRNNNSPAMKCLRHDKTFSGDVIANGFLKKQLKIRSMKKFPRKEAILPKTNIRPKNGNLLLQSCASSIHEPDAISDVQVNNSDISVLRNSDKHELPPPIKIGSSTMERQGNSSKESLQESVDKTTAGNPQITECVDINPTKTISVEFSSDSPNDGSQESSRSFSPTQQSPPLQSSEPFQWESVDHEVPNKAENQILMPTSRQSQKDGVDLQEDASISARLTKQLAIEYFNKLLKVNSTNQDLTDAIETLCELLQYHPLTLQLAAGYINVDVLINLDLKMTIENYLMGIEEQAEILDLKFQNFEGGEIVPDSAYLTLTLKMTFEKLKNMADIGDSIIEIMEIISFLSPENISLQFVLDIFHENPNNKDSKISENVFDLLKTYEMVTGSERLISIHPLVQKTFRLELILRVGFCNLNIILMCILKMLNSNKVPLDQMCHLESIWKHAAKNDDMIRKHHGFIVISIWICSKSIISGKYREAHDFSCRAIDVLERTSGMDKRWTLKLKYWQGVALRKLKKYSECLELLTTVYEKQNKLFGEEGDDCLKTANSIGIAYFNLNRYNEAMKWYRSTLECLQKRETISGKEHPVTLDVKYNIAQVLHKQCKYKESKTMYEEVLKVEELNGPNHQRALDAKFNVACIRYRQKSYTKALTMFTDILEVQERVLEVNHPKTLITKTWIADTYKSLKRIDEAIKWAKEVYEKRD